MENYTFSLNKVRNYKNQVLDGEKRKLAALQQKRDRIAEKIEELGKYRDEKRNEIETRQHYGAQVKELIECSILLENAKRQIEMMLPELSKAENEVESQRQVVLSVYQEKTGMDKLEEKQLEEYHFLEAKSFQNDMLQLISNRISSGYSNARQAI